MQLLALLRRAEVFYQHHKHLEAGLILELVIQRAVSRMYLIIMIGIS
ncbi:hypothetical protein [Corynebacterium cystitidis]|nr:hypothetical protein [Corynebacterium cystitidis]